MSANDIIMEVYLKKALYYYDFDLNTGIVKEDIVGKNGENYTKQLGLTSPCSFDELLDKAYDEECFGVTHARDGQTGIISQKYLLEQYNSGHGLVEETIYMPQIDAYHRLSYYIIENPETGRLHVYVSCMDVTEDEKGRDVVYGNLQNDTSEIYDIVASAHIGIWHIYLFDGEAPRMKATPTMLELMGLTSEDAMSEEAVYEFWHSRIKKSAMPSVNASVQEMINAGFSENTYTWINPILGERIVRCGGTSKEVKGKGYILRGYHSDVTDTVNAEEKHKQLLAEAFEELKVQKKLLQEALDNYKEADYDRRRDFLTGLRNRQDMFELLHDGLSNKRENIKSMFMMDIDNFKKLNDNYGHKYGDECLQKIGEALNDYGDKHDINFYRYGGEEMLGISFSDKVSADKIAEELVALIASLEIKRDDMLAGVVTVSLGYTSDTNHYEKMIDNADAAMYRAKDNGKNQAVCFENM